MRRLTAFLAFLVAALVSAAACSGGGGDAPDGSDGRPELVPRAGQVIVTGQADRVAAEGAQSEPLTPPFTISARERGRANLTIENAVVGGRPVAINWNSGTPLTVNGAGGLDLGAASVTVDGGGTTWNLDGPSRTFLPGTYRLSGSVAVGSSGFGTPRDAVDFEAQSRTLLSARGGTIVKLPPRQIEFDGPGTISVTGDLRVRTPNGEKRAGQAELRDGPFRVTLVPSGNRLRVEAILQGPVTSS